MRCRQAIRVVALGVRGRQGRGVQHDLVIPGQKTHEVVVAPCIGLFRAVARALVVQQRYRHLQRVVIRPEHVVAVYVFPHLAEHRRRADVGEVDPVRHAPCIQRKRHLVRCRQAVRVVALRVRRGQGRRVQHDPVAPGRKTHEVVPAFRVGGPRAVARALVVQKRHRNLQGRIVGRVVDVVTVHVFPHLAEHRRRADVGEVDPVRHAPCIQRKRHLVRCRQAVRVVALRVRRGQGRRVQHDPVAPGRKTHEVVPAFRVGGPRAVARALVVQKRHRNLQGRIVGRVVEVVAVHVFPHPAEYGPCPLGFGSGCYPETGEKKRKNPRAANQKSPTHRKSSSRNHEKKEGLRANRGGVGARVVASNPTFSASAEESLRPGLFSPS